MKYQNYQPLDHTLLKEHQPPLSVEEQVDNLISIGLIVPDRNVAESILNDISYFRLIKAYSLRLKEKNKNYFENVTFNEIVELYLFDANFRQILFPQIEKVEVNLRCRISNYFCCKYGVFGYKNINNFGRKIYFEKLLSDIQEEIDRNAKSPFIKNFSQHYEGGQIPLYAAIETFSFGTLSKFYKNMKPQDKKAIAKFYGVGYKYFESWIESISFVRNVCAHYGRLYNAKLPKTPILYNQYTNLKIGNFRIFAILICLKHLIPNDRHWNNFVDNIQLLFDKYPEVDERCMGFPKNWKQLLLQQKSTPAIS